MQPEDLANSYHHQEGEAYPPSESLGSMSRSRTQTESVGQPQPYSFRHHENASKYYTQRNDKNQNFKNFDVDEHGGTLDYDARR